MIYNKDAAFPYPMLSRTSASYRENYFDFDIDSVKDVNDYYLLSINYEISSPFIEKLLQQGKATLVLIAQSGDNYFERLSYGQKEVILKKNRFSLQGRTKLQLHIQSLEKISFTEADDINDFYQEFKDEIVVKRHSLLGYSDEVTFEDSSIKPLDLFEKSTREGMNVPFAVELTSETIVLVFKNREVSLEDGGIKSSIKNMYLYLGLNRALTEFIFEYGKSEEFVDVETITMPKNGLHEKLRRLMLSKNITEISQDNLDEVIQQMSDGIVEKFVDGVKEMSENGD